MLQARINLTTLRVAALITIAAFAFAVFAPATPAHAASFNVPCDADPNVAGAALRATMDIVNTNGVDDTVSLAAGCTYRMPDQPLPADPDYLNIAYDAGTQTTIEGNGATVTIQAGVDAPSVEVWGNANGVINNLIITGGHTSFCGGGLFSDFGSTMVVNNSTITNSTADNGGGVCARGVSATLTNVTISGNSAAQGGGVFVEGNTTVTINSSVIAGNTVSNGGGGIFVNGGSPSSGILHLNNSTVSSNGAAFDGGGLKNGGTSFITASTLSGNTSSDGAGLFNGSQLTVTNGTVSGNTASGSGGGLYSDASSTFYNVTFSGNSASSGGGGIYRNSGGFTMVNSIIANSGGGSDCAGTAPTFGYTLVEDGSCGVTSGSGGNLTGDPNLGPLADNGGGTLTHALLTGSIAINAGDNSNVPGGVTTDQTGAARIQDTTVDMGAVEGSGAVGVLVTISPAATNVTEGGTAALTVTRAGSTTGNLDITFTTGGSAPGGDYSATSPVTILDGSATATLNVSTNDNDVDQNSRTVVITLTDGAAYNLGANIVSTVTISDDDTAGVTVTPTSGLTTTEAGGTANFTVVLDSEPTADVTIAVSSSDTSEGTVAPASLTFTPANWDTAQMVTVTGVNDDVDDGDVAYTIFTAAATSSDSFYNGLNPADVSVTNTDNDTAGVTVTPTSGLVTTEAGGTDSFTVVLDSEPTADVTIAVSSSDTSESTVSAASLTFTSANWNTAQTVTVTGVQDSVDDGDVAYTIITAAAVSGDANYNGLNPADVSVTNTDDDTAGVTVTPTSGLTTTEAGGTAQFTVVLNSQPTADVTITVTSSDTTEGTVSPASLTFTTTNWATSQQVTVTGVDDDIDDANVGYWVNMSASSTDGLYNGISVPSVSLTNNDDDTAGVTVTPISSMTTEAGGTASFTVVLDSEPTANVVITVTSSDTTEGTVSPASLTFTPVNWATARTVTVTGVDDDLDDGSIAYSVDMTAASADSAYNGIAISSVSLTNQDDDTAGITVAPTTGLVTTEAGGTDTFDVVLNSEPTANVSISVTSSDTSEGTVSPASLTFTPGNWDTAQTVTVTGVDDDVDEGDVAYSVTMFVSSSDLIYNALSVPSVSVTNTDDDTAGITVAPTTGLVTTEAGGTAQFSVVLDSEPTANVSISVTSSDTSEGTVAPASLTFTTVNWNTAQTVTVTGVNDDVDDGDVAYTIVTAAATSSDSLYNGLNPADVSVTNTDNDTAGVTVTPTSGLVTTEAGGTAQFSVVLTSQPTGDVVIGLSSSDTSEGTVSPASLTFTSANWATAQNATVTGEDDLVVDGNVAYTIITAPATSSDANYNGFNPADVSVTNTDDDTAGVTVNPTTGLVTTEAGGTAQFSVVLVSEPTANVTISVVSDNVAEGTVAPASLIFTAANWNVPQNVTVTGVDDSIQDGAVAYSVNMTASSADSSYNGIAVSSVSVSNTDNDVAGLTAAPTSFTLAEGASGSYDLSLNTTPTSAPVTLTLTFDSTELTVNGSASPVTVDLSDTTPVTISVVSLVNPAVNTSRVVAITNEVTSSTAAEYPLGMSVVENVTITDGVVMVPTYPPPPTVPLAEDTNFDEDSVVRVGVPDVLRSVVRARVIVHNGSSPNWLGAPLYDSGNIGNQGILDLGVLQAVDLFSNDGQTYWNGGAVICLQGVGTLIWMPASQAPRVPQIIGSYTVPEFPGFTCATLFEPGMLVLVSDNPLD